ncbi:MAG: glycoside hydrolase family 15 protein [Rhodospirillaceae bacterium]|nr:glycoside hydrolase family 15 protein [Rhodospirillaceae bacterium]
MTRPIEDYGFIGNMVSCALVGRDGSIDWLCLPRFDSDACFAALLGTPENGRWQIAPRGDPPRGGARRTTRRYLPGTAILETRFETETGIATVTDFMPFTDDERMVDLIRIVRGEKGRVEFEMELALRFGYGFTVPWLRRRDYGFRAIAGPDAVDLATPAPLRGENLTTTSRFAVAEGESVPFTLAYHPSGADPRFVDDRDVLLERTAGWWRNWTSRRTRLDGAPKAWDEAVERSLITLKALSFQPTGALMAAATTSLPEEIGGTRNWDYRFCWLRDATRTLYALLDSDYVEEADAFREWLLRAAAGHPEQIQIMYGLAGERRISEAEVPWLAGYEGSKPVRIGNAAHRQLQLDVYGELMDALHAARRSGLGPYRAAWRLQRLLLKNLETIWRRPDAGIWEVRGEPQHFTYSKIMCWVAFDRGVKAAEHEDFDGEAESWRRVRDEIRAEILARGFDARRNCFVQHYDGRGLDAALLLMAEVGFLPPDDPRFRGTVEAIEHDLLVDGFVRRYGQGAASDGMSGEEGAFLACGYWLCDAYTLLGRRDDAVALFERLLAVRNDLGLLAEEYSPRIGRQLGNFPQAFSHVGLVNSAYCLLRGQGTAQRAGRGDLPPADAPARQSNAAAIDQD